MQTAWNAVYLEDGLQQLNTTAKNIGKCFRTVAKFLFALLVYLVLNTCVILLFNYTKPTSMELVRLFEYGLRVFTSENLTIIFSVFTQYKVVTLSLAAVATALSWMLQFSDKAPAKPIYTTKQRNNRTFSQVAVRRASVVSYKQHVAFLA